MDVSKTAVVFAGGDPEPASVRSLIPPDSLVIAADSGLDLVASLDLTVDVVVGDFDSVNPELLQAAVASGARVERHPVDKDATDLELALEAALT
ncbi:MAG: thiamine diphosphokinase, partial [Acidimicrobiia bacterium]